MKTRFRPSVEAVESKVLPTGSPVSVVLSADQPVYAPGDTVHLSLTVTDTGRGEVDFLDGPLLDGFSASVNGTTVWISNAGAVAMSTNPGAVFARVVALHPGESYKITADWKSPTTEPASAAPGVPVTFRNELAVDGTTATPLTVSFQPRATTPPPKPITAPLALGVKADRAVHRLGQPVTFTITETNVSDHDVNVVSGARILTASVTGPRGAVWHFRDLRASPTFQTVLHAGQSRTLTLTWNGRADARLPRVSPGMFAVAVGLDDTVASAAFRLTR